MLCLCVLHFVRIHAQLDMKKRKKMKCTIYLFFSSDLFLSSHTHAHPPLAMKKMNDLSLCVRVFGDTPLSCE